MGFVVLSRSSTMPLFLFLYLAQNGVLGIWSGYMRDTLSNTEAAVSRRMHFPLMGGLPLTLLISSTK